MLNTFRVASYGPSGQGVAGYEAAKGAYCRADRHLYHCPSGSAGNAEGPLRGTNPNRQGGGGCLHSLRIC